MKKILSSVLVACLSLGMFTGISFGEEAPKILINGQEPTIETSSMIKDGRTWVSMSSILTIFGYDVSWDATTKTSTVLDKSTGTKAQFSENTKNVPYTQTGIEKVAVLNEAPFVKNGRTFLQLNVFADIFCKDISYVAETNTVLLKDAFDDDTFEITKEVSGPISIGQNFKIHVSTDGSYEWIVSPNANFAYYAMVAEGVGNYSMYFKALAYEHNDKITLQKINSDTGKIISEVSYPVVVRNQGNEETTAEPVESKEPAILTLIENNEESQLTVINEGDTFKIDLTQNSASTGYQWRTTVPKGLELVDKQVSSSENPVPGASVKETWTFRALTSGPYELKFDYSRAWESVDPIKTATYKFEVK